MTGAVGSSRSLPRVRAGGGDHLIARRSLVERLRSSRVVLLEAPGGYGKTTLAMELATVHDLPTVRVTAPAEASLTEVVAHMARGFGRAGMPDLAGAMTARGDEGGVRELLDAPDRVARGVTLVVEDVHRLDPEAGSWLAEFIDALPRGARAVVCGRRLGRALAGLTSLPDVKHLTIGDLRFTDAEVVEILTEVTGRPPTQAEIDGVVSRTDGWPAAVALEAAGLGRGLPLDVGGPPGGLLERLVEAELARADAGTRALVADLAKLPLLSAEVAAAVGGDGSLDRLLDLGLPVRFRRDGWGELPDSLRELLAGEQPLPMDAARSVARVYARRGELGEAVTLLVGVADYDDLVALLAGRQRAELLGLGLPYLAVLLERVLDASLAGHIELLVNAVLVADDNAPELRPEWLARADRLAPQDGPVRRCVDAERARDLAREGLFDQAIDLAGEVITTASQNEELTLGRAHLARGITTLVVANGNANGEIVGDIEAAVALFRVAGETRSEASALQTLGVGVYQTLGAFDRAEESLAAAVALLSEPDRTRGLALTYLAEAATQRGNLEAAETANREAMAIGVRLAAGDVIGYAAWSQAAIAAQRRDGRGVHRALEEARANPGSWYERPAGIDFLADASTMQLLVGDPEGARRDLLLAEERAAGTGYAMSVLVARARFEATVGRPSAGIAALDDLDRVGIARDRCLYELLRAVCAVKLGSAAEAEAYLAAAQHHAAVLDDPERLARREPEMLAMIAGADSGVTPIPRVRLLGGFEVRRGGEDATPATGRPATLVKLIAIRGTLTTDEVIDALWDDADPSTGRARLRNLLNRVRTTSGPLVERRGEALSLVAGVEVDVTAFDRAATEALSSPPGERVGLARRAVAAYAGRLLPGDLYADWAAAPRERLQRRFLSLVDLLAADALDRGDLDEAVRLLDDAIAAEPMDLDRYAVAARALLTQGRRVTAAGLVERGLAVAEELGGVPAPELRCLADELAD